MPHLLVAGKLHAAGEALLQTLPARGTTVDYVTEVSEASCAARIADADALVIRTQPLTAATIARAKRLKVVSRHGAGYDSVDLAALDARGIALVIAAGANAISVAEHAMMQILATARRLLRADEAARTPGEWGWRNTLEAEDVAEKNLLILGYGRIGQRLARMAAAFDMRVRAHDPWLEENGWPAGDIAPTSLDAGLAWADFVSVHVPGGQKPVIGAQEIARMKPGAIIVNTARGGVVDEAALAHALASGHLGGAAIDVFTTEPPTHSPLLDQRSAILSPHIAGLTNDAGRRLALAAIHNALNYLDGTIDRRLIVNPESIHV